MTSTVKIIEISEDRILTFTLRFLNMTSVFGIVVFIFSTYMFFRFTSTLNRSSFLSFTTDVGMSQGAITDIVDTDFSEGSEVSQHPIYEVTFSYSVNNRTYFNKGYAKVLNTRVGDSVDVKYKLSDPSLAKADGLRTSHYGPYILLGILLPIAGIWILGKGVKWGNDFISIIKNGVITEGQFIKYLQDGDDFKHVYHYVDLTGNRQIVEHKKGDRNVISRVSIVYYRDDGRKAEVIDWKTLPIIFNRNRLKKILNGS